MCQHPPSRPRSGSLENYSEVLYTCVRSSKDMDALSAIANIPRDITCNERAWLKPWFVHIPKAQLAYATQLSGWLKVSCRPDIGSRP